MPGLYKIGEAAALLNLKTYVLRFWETEFPQVIPLRTETGRRVYTEEHLALLERIRFLLHERGLTIDGARRILREEAAKNTPHPLPAALRRVEGQNPAQEPVDPALFESPNPPLTDEERHFLEDDAAVLFSSAVEPACDERPDAEFLRGIRSELEQVADLLAGRAPHGGPSG